MSLLRQLWCVLAAAVMVAVAGSALVQMQSARELVQTQLQLKNNDNAQLLALSLAQQRGDAALLELALSAQFDTGFYAAITLRSPEGRALVTRRAPASALEAEGVPAWFTAALPVHAAPGTAQVSDGWRAVGALEVESSSVWAQQHLWQGSRSALAWLLAVALAAGALAMLVLGKLHAPLERLALQARALAERRFVQMPEPQAPELRELGRAMNGLAERLQQVFAEQGRQLEALRVQAQTDVTTGVANRAHFLASLEARLAPEPAGGALGGAGPGLLLLVRLRDLHRLNQRLGRAGADAALRALAGALQQPLPEAGQALVGRLNGSDFALLIDDSALPAHDGAAAATAVLGRLRNALAPWPAAAVAVGGVSCPGGAAVHDMLQAADQALAGAEQHEGHRLHLLPTPAGAPPRARWGQTQWRDHLQAALARGPSRAALAGYAVLARSGALLHLECPLRLMLPGGSDPAVALDPVPAAVWLPWALRGGLHAQADLRAVTLALAAVAEDGVARAVNLAARSLHDAGFVTALRELLAASPQGAQKLWLEVGAEAAELALPALRELARQLRPLGVRIGLEHAAAGLARVGDLYSAGLDYVKLDSTLCTGLDADAGRALFVRSLVGTLHGMGLTVIAEGVRNEADAKALWACDLDGITGHGVKGATPAAGV